MRLALVCGARENYVLVIPIEDGVPLLCAPLYLIFKLATFIWFIED